MPDKKKIKVAFYKTPVGNEPVRNWLKELPQKERKTIGEDIKAVEIAWPVGVPLVKKLDADLWEVRRRRKRISIWQKNDAMKFCKEVLKMKNKAIGSLFDDFLEAEGIKEAVEAGAIKKLISFQLLEAIKKENLTKTELALRLDTSRAAVDRLLDPENESVTLLTLTKAASVLGKKLKLELV